MGGERAGGPGPPRERIRAGLAGNAPRRSVGARNGLSISPTIGLGLTGIC